MACVDSFYAAVIMGEAGLSDSRLLLLWTKRFPTPFSPLSFNLSRAIAGYLLPLPFLVRVTGSALHYVSISAACSTSYVQLQSKIRANADSSWAVLSSGRIVLCGGSDGVKIAYLLTREGRVERLSNMTYARSAPGVIAWRGKVLTFGSFMGSGTLKCERLDLTSRRWTTLPDLHEARSYFTPEEWRGAVYLCGGHCFSIARFDGPLCTYCLSNFLKALEH